MEKIKQLLEERGRLIAQMRTLSEEHETFTAEQQALKARADRLQRELELENELDRPISNGTQLPTGDQVPVRRTDEYRAAVVHYLRTGRPSNALEVGTDSEGGFLTHEEFSSEMWKIREKFNALRGLCRTIRTNGDHKIRVEAGTGTATWLGEEGTYTESAPSFGLVTLDAYKLTRLVLVSEELLQDSDFDIESYLAEEFGRSYARAEEKAFIAGTGSGQPTGVLSGAGSVARTASPLTVNVGAEDLLDLFYGLDEVYRSDAVFLLNDSTVRAIRGITDANDNFIWQPGLQMGQPDRILGKPYVTSDHMPVVGESPLRSAVIFGDMNNYTIADRTDIRIQRLNELYAGTGQIGFRAWSRLDGKTVRAAGIKKLEAF